LQKKRKKKKRGKVSLFNSKKGEETFFGKKSLCRKIAPEGRSPNGNPPLKKPPPPGVRMKKTFF